VSRVARLAVNVHGIRARCAYVWSAVWELATILHTVIVHDASVQCQSTVARLRMQPSEPRKANGLVGVVGGAAW
jgi:hypothetical protein